MSKAKARPDSRYKLLSPYFAALFLAFIWAGPLSVLAQSVRIKEYNDLGWFTYNGTYGLGKSKFALHTEAQFRRVDFGSKPEQLLLRIGLNYKANSALTLQAGYCFVETYPYGEYPINRFGKIFPEHRTFQSAIYVDDRFRVIVTHRARLEQRWLAKYDSAKSDKPDSWLYTNRIRYMLRLQCPLQGPTLDDKEFYLAAIDELFINFGKNVGENVFDQNRILALLGFRINPHIRLEAGYISQILELGRRIDSKNVFQHNSGLSVNAVVNF